MTRPTTARPPLPVLNVMASIQWLMLIVLVVLIGMQVVAPEWVFALLLPVAGLVLAVTGAQRG